MGWGGRRCRAAAEGEPAGWFRPRYSVIGVVDRHGWCTLLSAVDRGVGAYLLVTIPSSHALSVTADSTGAGGWRAMRRLLRQEASGNFFLLFFLYLTVDAEGSYRTSLQSPFAYLFAARVTGPEGAVLNPLQGFTDLVD